MSQCDQCGKKGSFLEPLQTDPAGKGRLCYVCADIRYNQIASNAEKRKADEAAREANLRAQAEKVIVTTTPHVDGCTVVKYLGVESVEYVIGTGLFSEVVSDIADIFGARSKMFEKKLSKAKEETFLVLKLKAAQKGANAVVGVDLDYTEFSGNRVALIVNGTLVRLQKTELLPP